MQAQGINFCNSFLAGVNVPGTFVVVKKHSVGCLSVNDIHRFLVESA